jgi:hypothetical protein
MNTYPRGADVKLRSVITVDDVDTDPTALTLEVRPPSEVITVYTYPTGILKSAAGDYYKIVDANATGTWRYRWSGTGVAKGAAAGAFEVDDDAFD